MWNDSGCVHDAFVRAGHSLKGSFWVGNYGPFEAEEVSYTTL